MEIVFCNKTVECPETPMAFDRTEYGKLLAIMERLAEPKALTPHERRDLAVAMETVLQSAVGLDSDLPPGFRTTNYVRDWLPIRREQCAKRVSWNSRWSRSCARRIATQCRRWPSDTGSASRRSTPGASVLAASRRTTSGA
jgi:hypothetical protein